MKYSNQIEINLPLNRVIELFDNADNMSKWQPDLISFEHISGEPGQAGAKSNLHYKMRKRDLNMVETIIANDLPNRMESTYEVKGTLNIQINKFEAIDNNKTRWVSDSEFQFSSFPMKVFGWLSPGTFKKQSYQFMEMFKKFAEGEG